MPRLIAIAAAGATQRRLLKEQKEALEASGFRLGRRIQGGTWGELFALSGSEGLFAEKEYIVVEDAVELGALPPQNFRNVGGDEEMCVLLLVFEKIGKGVFPKEIADRVRIISEDAPPFWFDAKVSWLRSKARGSDIRLDEDAAHLLVEFMEDPEELLAEVNKIGSYSGDRKITAELVRKFSFDEGKSDMLRFVDAFCRAEWKDVLASFPAIRREDSFLPALTALHNRVRLALYMMLFQQSPEKNLSAALGAKPYQSKMAAECVKHYSKADLLFLSHSLIATSYGEKTGRGTGVAGFESAVLRVLRGYGNKKRADA